MDIHTVFWVSPIRPILIFIPGFFTRPLTKGVTIDRTWDTQVLKVCETYDLNGMVVRWDSGNIFDLDLSIQSITNSQTLQSMLRSWRNAYDASNMHVRQMVEYISSIPQPIYLVGHSLGGKIALQIAEYSSLPNIDKLLALAPAISAKNVNYQSIAASVNNKPIVCHSNRDRVLSILFPCGQSQDILLDAVSNMRVNPKATLKYVAELLQNRSDDTALGLLGVPQEHLAIFRSIQTRFRHAEYSHNLEYLWRITQ